jgi:hypothetical protein
LELGFATKGLRRTCEQDAWARRELGEEVATALQRRLADLEAAETITELPWLNIDAGAYRDAAIEFYPGYWLLILAIGGAANMDRTQKVDWTTVDRIKLTGIRRP